MDSSRPGRPPDLNVGSNDGTPSIPEPTSPLRCCCGRLDCAYLEHNNVALAGLERDVETAAQLGQALLNRHESYMAEAEEDHARMQAEIERLEREKREVQAENARMLEENRDLLEQLENLNLAVIDSDSQIKTLTAALEATQLEIRRLAVSASRADGLEAQLSNMELEQAHLLENLTLAREDERSAMQRWKRAESTLRELHEQVDKMEKEAREERERHVEMMGRMERRRVVERELDSAANRLKGAATTSSVGRNKDGTNVVSHFVRDILQDNANLQMGIVELRAMLQSSNEEVQALRDQVFLHQPRPENLEAGELGLPQGTFLSEELEDRSSRRISQEFHVHHHFHTSTPSNIPRKERQIVKARPRRRRPTLPPGMMPSTPISHHPNVSTSSASTILSQTSATIPRSSSTPNRLSQQSPGSDLAYSSNPSSPLSNYRTSSIFDRLESSFDISRPTSPESNGLASPTLPASSHRKSPSDFSLRSISSPSRPADQALADTDLNANLETNPAQSAQELTRVTSDMLRPLHKSPIPEEQESDTETAIDIDPSVDANANPNAGTTLTAEIPTDAGPKPNNDGELAVDSGAEAEMALEDGPGSDECTNDSGFRSSPHFRPMRRAASHDSLISISGMDIHTLRDHPSAYIGSHFAAFAPRLPTRMVSPSTALSSSPPVLSATNIIISKAANDEINGVAKPTPQDLLSSVAGSKGIAATRAPKAGLGRRVGGWMLGKWGMAPASSSESLREQAALNAAAERPGSSASSTIGSAESVRSVCTSSLASTTTQTSRGLTKTTSVPAFMTRPPGVNQKGPIPGFRPPKKAPSNVHVKAVNEALLRETLEE